MSTKFRTVQKMILKRIILLIGFGLLNLCFLLQTYDSYSQNRFMKRLILVVENTTPTKRHHKKIVFHQNTRILIERLSNDTIIRGRFKILTDSSIKIKSKIISLHDIKSIRSDWAKQLTIISAPIAGFFSTSLIIFSIKDTGMPDDINDYYSQLSMMGCAYSLPAAIIGGIALLTQKNHKLDKDWKIYIKNKRKK
jgi:hypothetical protein